MLIDFATTEVNFVICCIIHAVHVVVQFYPWFEYFVCLICVLSIKGKCLYQS